MFDEPRPHRGSTDDRPPHQRHQHHWPERSRSGGSIPDGLLIGAITLLLTLALVTWTATGLAGLLSHGIWPQGVTFSRTPMAMGALATQPHDLAGAWPEARRSQLSGYGLFWGLFIGQLLVISVLTLSTAISVTRARANRAARRSKDEAAPETQPATEPQHPEQGTQLAPAATPEAESTTAPVPEADHEHASIPAVPAPHTAASEPSAEPEVAPSAPAPAPGPEPDAQTRLQDAPGAALITTANPELWAATKDARAKLGPVHLFDPTHLCETPARLRWSPHHACEHNAIAASRAAALLAPLRSPRPIDAEVHSTAQTLLRCWLHAAALSGKPFRELHRWANAKTAPSEPVQTLRTHSKASSGSAGELEAALTSHPDRRRSATELIRSALAPLAQLHVRNACMATRADRIALESFVNETGTLYVVGSDPEVMPILNALTQCVVEHGRRMAGRSSPGRLDPPLTSILELPLPAPAMPCAVHQPNEPS